MSVELEEDSVEMIMIFEISSKNYYNSSLKAPNWPGGNSGVTIGIGYELAHVTEYQFQEDWGEFLTVSNMNQLKAVIGLSGQAAKNKISSLKNISITWQKAKEVFRSKSLPKFQIKTEKIFPGCQNLHPLAYGVLVSFVYNRGESIANNDNRKQMLNISKAFKGQIQYEGTIQDYIASQIRSMKRLWLNKNLGGLIQRRQKEARVVEENKKLNSNYSVADEDVQNQINYPEENDEYQNQNDYNIENPIFYKNEEGSFHSSEDSQEYNDQSLQNSYKQNEDYQEAQNDQSIEKHQFMQNGYSQNEEEVYNTYQENKDYGFYTKNEIYQPEKYKYNYYQSVIQNTIEIPETTYNSYQYDDYQKGYMNFSSIGNSNNLFNFGSWFQRYQ